MTIDDFIKKMKLTPENVEERVEKIRYDSWGMLGGDVDYDCRPSGVILNGIAGDEEEIKITWDEIIDYVLCQQIRMW